MNGERRFVRTKIATDEFVRIVFGGNVPLTADRSTVREITCNAPPDLKVVFLSFDMFCSMIDLICWSESFDVVPGNDEIPFRSFHFTERRTLISDLYKELP